MNDKNEEKNIYILTKEETETTIAFTKADKEAIVYTEMKDWIRRLDGYCEEFPDSFRTTQADAHSKTYTVPVKYVKIVRPRRISQREKDIRVQRLRNARKL